VRHTSLAMQICARAMATGGAVREPQPRNIRVNAATPGIVSTPRSCSDNRANIAKTKQPAAAA